MITKNIYKNLLILLIGVIMGIIITIKWIAPPSDDINIGKIKIKGDKNKIEKLISK